MTKHKMKVIHAYQKTDGVSQPIPLEAQKADYPRLNRMHKQALKKNPTWGFFGGTLTIENRHYQVG